MNGIGVHQLHLHEGETVRMFLLQTGIRLKSRLKRLLAQHLTLAFVLFFLATFPDPMVQGLGCNASEITLGKGCEDVH
jgi:hypothetical protein